MRARWSARTGGSGRSSAARATPSATTSRRMARRHRIRCRSRSSAPRTRTGTLVPRRARRTGNVFWGCSKYPKCDYTTNNEPLGGVHDTDDGPLARKGEAAICLRCGSTSETGPDDIVPGERYAGGPADPAALARPARGRAGGSRGRCVGARRARGRGAPRHGSVPPSRHPEREPGRGGPCDPPDAGSLPSVARRPRRVAAHDPGL